jgi:hypothetical protein
MGVARFPGTAANPFRIDSKARTAGWQGRAFIEELWDDPDCVLPRDPCREPPSPGPDTVAPVGREVPGPRLPRCDVFGEHPRLG